jgi:DNA-binding NtrC family response regulator
MNVTLHALLIDDEQTPRAFVRTVLEEDDWNVRQVASVNEAVALLSDETWSIVLCDVRLGRADRFVGLRRFKEELPDTKVVLMTGADSAVDATAFGAYDYLLKSFGAEELRSLSANWRAQFANKPYRAPAGWLAATYRTEIDMVGRSNAVIEIMKQVDRVAATNLPVFLTGEAGTGKEFVASALHRRSDRAQRNFVGINCAAIPGDLIESELFGRAKGTATADRGRRGLWAEADGGTVFLDEIAETSLSFQEKLLRVLQGGMVRSVGVNQLARINPRVIASSDRDIEEEVRAGRFRDDLFYRLNAISITLPPLRERREDIPPLAQAFADRVYSLRPRVHFSAPALELLERYPWPGNLRELENAVVRAAAVCDGSIRAQDLPERIRKFQDPTGQRRDADSINPGERQTLPSLSVVEGRYVSEILEHTGGNKQAAARILGVDRKTLDRMIKRHNIQFRRPARVNREPVGRSTTSPHPADC